MVYMSCRETVDICHFRLHQLHAIVTVECGVCLSVCMSLGVIRCGPCQITLAFRFALYHSWSTTIRVTLKLRHS